MIIRFLLTLAAGGSAFAVTAAAQAAGDPVCEHKGTNGMVTMLLCPKGLDQVALKSEGELACGERMPCGVWIWSNADAVPDAAPDAHDKMPKESVQAAVAIWVNENQQLMMIEKSSGN